MMALKGMGGVPMFRFIAPDDSTVMVGLACGSLSGIASSTVSFLLDLVRRQMQLEGAAGWGRVYNTGVFAPSTELAAGKWEDVNVNVSHTGYWWDFEKTTNKYLKWKEKGVGAGDELSKNNIGVVVTLRAPIILVGFCFFTYVVHLKCLHVGNHHGVVTI
ncbi:hypothetical protein L6452_08969 [Arctium lappa]|uniref:Uncharacterized protein n=1 Tax=Arctium lappa TaxID=4217 RepID=A0ACB9DJ29_ARCLA|nr:hypothetical protein L6452_08969 [Arctium lappa]